MTSRPYLISKAERDLRTGLPRVEVTVTRPKKDEHDNDTKVAVLSGSAGTVLTLAGKKVLGESLNAAGRKVWNSDAKRRVVRRLRRT